MLSEEERREMERELEEVEAERGAVIDALNIVQRHRGWVADEHVRDIARMLDMTPAEVENVATFYSLIFRKPVGRHTIMLCDSVSCWIMGQENLLEHLRRTLGIGLGETTPDDRFTLLPSACLGCCDQAPAMMVDEDLHTRLTAERVDEVLADYE